MRTTSKPLDTPPPTEAQARASLTLYIRAHLAVESLMTTAKQEIEAIKIFADDKARPHEDEKALHETVLMRYAEAHPELFTKRQKTELYGGHKIGWQVCPLAVTLCRPTGAKKKQTWDGFLEACRQVGSMALDFIRTKDEPDKEAVLLVHRVEVAKAKETGDSAQLTVLESQLARLGIQVTQEENFVIDLNLQPEQVQKAA